MRQISYQPNIIKRMDSLMFTFSADQTSLQLGSDPKHSESISKSFRRRPSSSKTYHYEKNKLPSSNRNQLFENSLLQNSPLQSSPSKNLLNLKTKNSSIQIHQKRKLRNIIDNMLGNNFDSTNTNKLDSIIVSNRKNINKHRSYLNATKKHELRQTPLNDTASKQNQFNSQNIVMRSHSHNEDSIINENKYKANAKLKKFQFANIKINKITNHSQRYPQTSQNKQTSNNDRKLVNISRDSIDRESLGKKTLKSRTPKIMYPESDSKLPSVFKNQNMRSSLGESLKKRTRLTSAHFISETAKQLNDHSVVIQKKKTLENPPSLDPSLKLNFRPQSTMLSNKRYSTASERQQITSNLYHPKRLIFDCNQDVLGEEISKKLGTNLNQTKSSGLRVSTRAKSSHVSYVHRKLRQINTLANEPSIDGKEQKNCVNNESLHSRDTAEASDFQESTERTLPNLSDKLTKSVEEKQILFIGGLDHCVTFQVHKE